MKQSEVVVVGGERGYDGDISMGEECRETTRITARSSFFW